MLFCPKCSNPLRDTKHSIRGGLGQGSPWANIYLKCMVCYEELFIPLSGSDVYSMTDEDM